MHKRQDVTPSMRIFRKKIANSIADWLEEEAKGSLKRPIILRELTTTLNVMQGGKSLGLDGLILKFYKA